MTSIGERAFGSYITTVYVYADFPVYLGYGAFLNEHFDVEKTLYVPTPADVDRYKNSEWNQYFANILPMTGEMLDVKNIQCDTPATQTYFDLNGRKMKQPQHGLNIINGKKVVVK